MSEPHDLHLVLGARVEHGCHVRWTCYGGGGAGLTGGCIPMNASDMKCQCSVGLAHDGQGVSPFPRLLSGQHVTLFWM